jgi:hypothetical protein
MKKTITLEFTQSQLDIIYDALSEYDNMIDDGEEKDIIDEINDIMSIQFLKSLY